MGEKETPEALERVLKETYRDVGPADSWDDLRKRIDERLAADGWRRQGVFWRRVAVAMAACFLVTAGLSVWFRTGSHEGDTPRSLTIASLPGLTDSQIRRLGMVFEQIRVVFADQAAWFTVDSSGETRIGVSNEAALMKEAASAVVIRLALQGEIQAQDPRYLDVVAVLQRRVDLQIPLAEGILLEVSLLPRLRGDGRVVLETAIQAGGDIPMGGTVAVSDAPYTSLARVRAGDTWVQVQAIAKVVPI